MRDYSEIGYTPQLNRLNSQIETQRKITPFQFRSQFQVGGVRLRSSRLQVSNFVKISGTATALGTISDGNDVAITLTLAPTNTFKNSKVMGIPHMAVYQGTAAVGSLQIYPIAGAGISFQDYSFYGGFDYNQNDPAGTNSVYSLVVENNSGTTQPIYVIGNWKYIQENDGESQIG